MKRRAFRMALCSLALLGWAGICPAAAPNLARAFRQPPPEFRPWVYWFWINGNISAEGITADLEAMQRAGLGGVILMEVDVGIPAGPVRFMSPEWRRLFCHAVAEAERLGLHLTLNVGPGWTGSGGPWVRPEQSMQHLVASEVEVVGPSRFEARLPRPKPRPPYFGTAGLPPELLRAQTEFYQDVAVLAFPTPAGRERIADVDEKALYVRDPYSSKPGVKTHLPARAEYPALPEGAAIPRRAILDLTARLETDGRLGWTVPPGRWTILRFGRASTGANTRPAPAPGLGLECDKFDRAALEAHFAHFVGALRRETGPRRRRDAGWTGLHLDSWEMGAQNWTAAFREEFRRRRAYDPLPYLPVMTGRVVESLEVSERFLWDLRQTAQELVLENHAALLKALARRHGFGLSVEPYDMNPTADLNLGAVADVPMGEFWARGFDTWFSCFEAASIAHTGGRRLVAAEAFTADDRERWRLHPGNLKALGDWAFCAGVNRLVIHRYAHQPWPERAPGMTMGPYGVHWERTQTWWDLADAYHRYLARCQMLLQQGEAVADILYLTPEGAPQVFSPPPSAVRGHPPDRREYNFDACSPETLRARATVQGGRIVFPGGTSYRLLALPYVETMTPPLLRKLKELVAAGATLVGAPPRKSPSLAGYPRCDGEVQALAREIWGESSTGPRRLGRGRVFWSRPPQEHAAAPPLPADLLRDARWIWLPEGHPAASAPVGTRYFQRTMVLPPGAVESARIVLTADNAFTLWVNGRRAGAGNDFTRWYEFDLTALLQPGTNLLAVAAENGGDRPNPAGLIAALYLSGRAGVSLTVPSDARWRAAARLPRDGPNTPVEDPDWRPAQELGPFGMSPWGRPAPVTPAPELYPDYAELTTVLRADGVPPDFEADQPLRYTHRRAGRAEIYLVANPTAETLTATGAFRVTGKMPELWNPLTGEIRRAPDWSKRGGQTRVPLRLEAHDSLFVVFRDRAQPPDRPGAVKNWTEFIPVGPLAGPWEVRFATGRDGPERVTLDRLLSWSAHPDPGVRHFSGVAVYRTSFHWAAKPSKPSGISKPESEIYLDLGRVEVMARVRLNGADVGTVWKAPFRLRITPALRPGDNELEIEVANLWPNRLIGDAGLPAHQRVAWTTWNPFTADTPLLESGLLGPVRLVRPAPGTE